MYKITLYFLDHTEEKPSTYTFRANRYVINVKAKALFLYSSSNDKRHKVYEETEKEVCLSDTMVVEIDRLGGKEKHFYRIQRKRTPENTIKFGI